MSEKANIFVKFELKPVRMAFKSEEAGHDVHEMREFVTILIGGDKHSEFHGEATDAHRERFAEVYFRFKNAADERAQLIGDGTALSEVAFLNAAQVKDLEALNIFTVQALAALSDTAKQRVGMGSGEIVAKAKAFLAQAKDTAHATKLAAENERLKADNDDLKRQLADLAARLEALEKGGSKRGQAAA